MATTSLSPKRALERLRQHRACVVTLAHHAAKREIKRQLKAQGLRPGDMSHRDMCLEAERWFDAHRAELIAEAEHVIATTPLFARWRRPVPQTDNATAGTEKTQLFPTTSAIFRGSCLLIAC
jgi:hypothetical protein